MRYHRQAICRFRHKEKITVPHLAKRFMVSRPTIYNVPKKACLRLFIPLTSKKNVIKPSIMVLNVCK
jgi:hypothetical protein